MRVIWDNAPAHRGEAVREYLRTPGLDLRLVNLPGYSPDFNADEAIWGWPAGAAKSNGAAGRCCNRGPKRSCQIPGVRQMHVPPWPWFRV